MKHFTREKKRSQWLYRLSVYDQRLQRFLFQGLEYADLGYLLKDLQEIHKRYREEVSFEVYCKRNKEVK